MAEATEPERDGRLDRVREVRSRLVRDGTAVTSADGAVRQLFPVAVGDAEGAAIRSWVIRERAARTIEIGLGYGISALFICEGLLAGGSPDARHVVIDPNQPGFGHCGLQVLDEAGVAGLVHHHADPSQIALPRLCAEDHEFDLAFVDGNHRFDAVFVDLYFLGRLVRPGGVIFLDDYHLPGIARAASFFLANLGWTLEETSAAVDRHHWAVLRTSTTPDARPFDYFADF